MSPLLTDSGERHGQISLSVNEIWLEREGATEFSDSVVQLSLRSERDAEVVVRFR